MAKDRSNRPLARWGHGDAAARAADPVAATTGSPASKSAALRKWRKEEGPAGAHSGKQVISMSPRMTELLAFAHKQLGQLGPWEQKFVASLDQFVARHQGLTAAQLKKLEEVLSR